MRPLYESAKDRTREEKVMRRLADASSRIRNYHKIENINYGTDFLVETDGGFRVVEIKCRQKKYPFFLVAMHKILTAKNWEGVGIDAFLCVHWAEDDTVYLARPIGWTPWRVEWNGRTKMGRGDKADMEPHARFQLRDMRQL